MKKELNISSNRLEELVTIIMPVRNGESLIIDAINSINNQTIKPSKVILADNNSKDNTIEFFRKNLKKSIKLEIFESKKDLGAMHNFFRCINEVETKYFCWLAHDDYFADNWLEENLLVHIREKECITSFGKTIFISESGMVTYPTGIKENMNVPNSYTKGNLIKFIMERQLFSVFYEFGIHNTFLFKEALVSAKKINKLNSIKVGGDTCLVLSLLSKGSLCNTKKTIFYRRLRQSSDGCKVSKTNLFFRIFILELPWSYFKEVSGWICETYKKPRLFILIILIISSRVQSIKKIFKRFIYEIKKLIKNVLKA